MFRHFEQYDTDLNTYMKKQRESLKHYEPHDLSDLSERSDEQSEDDRIRVDSLALSDKEENKDDD